MFLKDRDAEFEKRNKYFKKIRQRRNLKMGICWLVGIAFCYFLPEILWGLSYIELYKIAQSLDGFQIILQNLGIITTTPSEWAAEKLVTCIMIILGLIFCTWNNCFNKNKPSKPVGNNYQKRLLRTIHRRRIKWCVKCY